MKNYSLKRVFYGNNNLLNEMALITPRNFLEKIIKLCKEKPQLIGDPSINYVEEAELQMDSFIRRYVKMLLSY